MEISRGSIFYADLSGGIGSEQDGIRPVLIIQNDTGNKYSPTVIAAAITSKEKRSDLPTHVNLSVKFGLRESSIVMLEQIRTLDKSRLGRYVGSIDDKTMQSVEKALAISLGQADLTGRACYGK
ncbi:type II toxin-antitoxin system PemK/MazF family toxin [Neglecta sp. X4]|nr:type II toxin-antitoxin system PemK/MazF family toxin [Neglectibacter sp. 59]NBJ72920.1 type II toxin-antitoxin system PemK/MazF family toxin [Neglectibacter sp. X4]NCE80884.1 type II toxin-antitoxin system PemK/MazF family toxin [Neglectibacter sp. X58]